MLHGARMMVVGLGHMGGALVEGFLAQGIAPAHIQVIDPAPAAAARAKTLGVDYAAELDGITHPPAVVLLAIKPQLMAQVVPTLTRFNQPGAFFLSIAAGVEIATLQELLGADARIVRAMPNLPAAIRCGMSVLCHSGNLAVEQMALAETLMACVGSAAWLDDEKLMNAVTAVSGSGPAYFFLLMESLAQAGIALGLPPALAQELAVETAWGAGQLAHQRAPETAPAALRESVTSPGGTTAAALDVLYAEGLPEIMARAVRAAAERGAALNA